jgi:deoxyribonuclease-4
VLIGSHVHSEDPLAAADADGAEVVQFFLGDPQSWKKPKPRDDAQTLKASTVPLYVHAPYLINVASANNRVRIPSRKILQDTCDAATEVGATAVIVHGGHADDKDMEAGFCLDTCHAWAAGEALIDAVERIKAITGRIDLVHCNDSRDAAGSGADRHANFGTGQIDPQLLVAVVNAADAPVICETADEGRKDDIAFLREHAG